MSKTVIFVDDDQRCIDSMRRTLLDLPECSEWNMIFCTSPSEAIAAAQTGITVLATDEHMPEMSGHELINKVKTLHPDAITILLSGDPDGATSPETIVIEKPCESRLLAETIIRSLQANSPGGNDD